MQMSSRGDANRSSCPHVQVGMRRITRLGTAMAVLCVAAAVLASAQSPKREPVVGLPCDGCEAAFEGMPSQLHAAARIAPAGERGEPMRIVGTVRDRQGRPAAGVIVYAYQTNAAGLYPASTTRHGALRGWVKTDASGRYQFDTIRPGGYPNTT